MTKNSSLLFPVKILILGVSGMLGNTLFRFLSNTKGFSVMGTVRPSALALFSDSPLINNIIPVIDLTLQDQLETLFNEVKPDIIINCIGIIKQASGSDNPLNVIPLNSIFPHQLANLINETSTRLIHISTDCVFSGKTGMYKENDLIDVQDLYGLSKYLGEVDYPNTITLRTSIIGHELDSSRSLISWFLSQTGCIKGYSKAIFSGLPTVEIARVIRDYVFTHPELHGLYHLSADPISKYDLLQIVAKEYKKNIDIEVDEGLVIDRSLDSTRFMVATGYHPPDWGELVKKMCKFG